MDPSSASVSPGVSPATSSLQGVPGGALAFSVLCLLGLLTIVCGVLFEVGRVRREGAGKGIVVARDQFAWRMGSALVWFIALCLLAYASSWGWPRKALALGLDGRAWLQVLVWAMLLTLVGILLLAHDLWRVRSRTSAQEAAFKAGLALLAQQEIERAQALRRPENPDSP